MSAGKPVVVVTQWIHPESLAYLSTFARPIPNESRQPLPAQELRRRCREAHALIVFMPDRIDEEFVDDCPRLRVIAGALKGCDNLDVEACTRRRIWVTVVPDLLTEPTADLAVALLLALTRHLRAGDRLVRSGAFAGWRPQLYGIGLQRRRAGIVGMGAVGRALARRLAAFGLEIFYYDRRRLPFAEEAPLRLRYASLPDVLREADFVFPLLPLTPDTHHLFEAATLAQMKPGSILVNCGRGSLVDEEAVADALQSGHLAGYAADVFEMEDWARPDRPRAIPPRLLSFEHRTLFTPHLGSAVTAVRLEIERHAARQIAQALRGQTPEGAVNDLAALEWSSS